MDTGLEIHRAIVEQFADGIIFVDCSGSISIWNAGAEHIFGHAAEHVVGKSLELIIPDELRAAHWAGFNRAMASGTGKYGRRALVTRAVHKDGNRLYVELSFALIKDQADQVIGAVAGVRDVTAGHIARRKTSP